MNELGNSNCGIKKKKKKLRATKVHVEVGELVCVYNNFIIIILSLRFFIVAKEIA